MDGSRRKRGGHRRDTSVEGWSSTETCVEGWSVTKTLVVERSGEGGEASSSVVLGGVWERSELSGMGGGKSEERRRS